MHSNKSSAPFSNQQLLSSKGLNLLKMSIKEKLKFNFNKIVIEIFWLKKAFLIPSDQTDLGYT